MNEYRYKIRAHHGMCIAFFKGKGYSIEFAENMQNIINELQSNPLVYITDEVDDFCKCCPNNLNNLCTAQEKVIKYDKQVLKLCGLKSGDILPFNDFKKSVYDNILSRGKRETICGSCEWNDLCKF